MNVFKLIYISMMRHGQKEVKSESDGDASLIELGQVAGVLVLELLVCHQPITLVSEDDSELQKTLLFLQKGNLLDGF